MADLPTSQLRLVDLTGRSDTDFLLTPTASERAAVAKALDINGIKKLRFAGALTPLGPRDWRLTAQLGATIVQDCVITLAPVTTRLDETIARSYMAELPEVSGAELEMPEDDSVEPLPGTIDLVAVMIEALSLALPAFPRSQGAALGEAVFTDPRTDAMTDADARPFAGLSDLRDSLTNKGDKTDGETS